MRERLYAQMLLIRRFEKRILGLFADDEFFGTTDRCIGQEANAVSIINQLKNATSFSAAPPSINAG
jgi:TPP-dependent pyruvate/acetoin dehydrogenase alpha subunit